METFSILKIFKNLEAIKLDYHDTDFVGSVSNIESLFLLQTALENLNNLCSNFLHLLIFCLCRTSKVKNKGPKDIMAVEDMNGEVRFSAHLPYPNNLSRSRRNHLNLSESS